MEPATRAVCRRKALEATDTRDARRRGLRDRDNRGGASDSGGELEGTGGRLSGISRAHIVGRELEGTSHPGDELEETSVDARHVVVRVGGVRVVLAVRRHAG